MAVGLFDRSEPGIVKAVLRVLNDFERIPLNFIPMVFEKMTTMVCPIVVKLGCRIFRRQFEVWEGAVPESLCDFIFGVIEEQDYAAQKSCLGTLFLYYDLNEKFLNEFCHLIVRFLDDEGLALLCLKGMWTVCQRYPEYGRLFCGSFRNVVELIESEDLEVSKMAAMVMAVLWDENGEFILGIDQIEERT
jgi:hypothetical protein